MYIHMYMYAAYQLRTVMRVIMSQQLLLVSYQGQKCQRHNGKQSKVIASEN